MQTPFNLLTTPRLSPLMLGALALLATAGCASGGSKAPPAYNASAGPQAQAGQFIETRNGNKAQDIGKLAITTCQVAFATHQRGSSQTSGHAFDTRDNTVEAKISQHYYLKGMTEADFQQVTNRICAAGEQELVAAGYDVMPITQLRQTTQFQALTAAGKPSPFDTKIAKTDYKVVAPTGYAITDEATTGRAAGGLAGLGNAFRQASGSNPASLEATLGYELGVTPARLLYTVDVASITTSEAGFLGQNKQAVVEGKVNLQLGGALMLVPPSSMGKRSPRDTTRFYIPTTVPAYVSKRPIANNAVFYDSVEDATTTGDRVAGAVSTAVGFLTAMAGGTGISGSKSRFNVNVQPAAFGDLAVAHARGFTAMAAYQSKTQR